MLHRTFPLVCGYAPSVEPSRALVVRPGRKNSSAFGLKITALESIHDFTKGFLTFSNVYSNIPLKEPELASRLWPKPSLGWAADAAANQPPEKEAVFGSNFEPLLIQACCEDQPRVLPRRQNPSKG